MTGTVLESLNSALHSIMTDDPRVVVMGEDVLDPYGGAFKVTRGLSQRWPDRVLTTPISEAGFTGVAAGMAMRGLRPVVEIMFGDFLLLAADQILNHITKYRWMYNEKVSVPITIRAPMGGGRGYGPTHSQSVEKHFLGVPGLRVVAPSPFHDPGHLLRQAVVEDDDPVLLVENKLMYAKPLRTFRNGRDGHLHARSTNDVYPTLTLSYSPLPEIDLTIVAYGGMAEAAVSAAKELLIDDEVFCEVVVPSSLQPMALEPVCESLQRSGRLLVCEEGTLAAGWGAEVISRVTDTAFDLLLAAPMRVAALDMPIGNARSLEEAILPSARDIAQAARKRMGLLSVN